MPPPSIHATGRKRRARRGGSLLGLPGRSPLISITCGLFIFSHTLSIPAWVHLDSLPIVQVTSPTQPLLIPVIAAFVFARACAACTARSILGLSCSSGDPRNWGHPRGCPYSGHGSQHSYYPFRSPDTHCALSPMETSPHSAHLSAPPTWSYIPNQGWSRYGEVEWLWQLFFAAISTQCHIAPAVPSH